MKRFIVIAAATCALVFAATAAAALEPGVYDPGNTGCPTATYSQRRSAPRQELPDADERGGRRGHHRPRTARRSSRRRSRSRARASARAVRRGSTSSRRPAVLPRLQQRRPDTKQRHGTYTFTREIAASRHGPITGTITGISILIDVQGTRRHLEHHGQRRQPGRPGRPADLEGPVQEGRVEELQQPVVQEPGAVRQLRRAPLQSRADQAQAQPEASRGLVPFSSHGGGPSGPPPSMRRESRRSSAPARSRGSSSLRNRVGPPSMPGPRRPSQTRQLHMRRRSRDRAR